MNTAVAGASVSQADTQMKNPQRPSRRNLRAGFTLIELLVVIAIIAILAGMLLPALSKAKMKTKGTACTSNFKQLQLGFNLYTSEFADKLPRNQNPNAPSYQDPNGWIGATEYGSANVPTPVYPSNDFPATNGTLFKFTGAPALYRCPAQPKDPLNSMDHGTYSVCMNGKLGGPSTAPLSLVSSLLNPGNAFVFVDMKLAAHCDLIVNPTDVVWSKYPGARHGNAGLFSFADGHVELSKWQGSLLLQEAQTASLATSSHYYTGPNPLTGSDLADLVKVQSWLQ